MKDSCSLLNELDLASREQSSPWLTNPSRLFPTRSPAYAPTSTWPEEAVSSRHDRSDRGKRRACGSLCWTIEAKGPWHSTGNEKMYLAKSGNRGDSALTEPGPCASGRKDRMRQSRVMTGAYPSSIGSGSSLYLGDMILPWIRDGQIRASCAAERDVQQFQVERAGGRRKSLDNWPACHF